ncbi:hypothetical protein B0A50_02760 [Salinomyces thailandicus]|uniref:Thiolase-like protein type 1 additional C-terminal domain-containing protein n=1 Tax=Salinomyces thailandicus TaxID=706561 RepID=A0A4U0U4K6_9PEZI|nr:hypothetical protein B0A50_02760 [Salinomyces thailandica]
MGVSGNTPIIVGVGDVSNRSKKVEDAIEPLELMLQAIRKALDDLQVSSSSAASLRSNIDSLDVVRSWTWPYPDLPGLIAERLDITPARQHCTDHGGNQPAYLLDEAARRISKGESKVAILTGGEALASLTACAAAKTLPPPGWTKVEQDVSSVFSPTTRELAPNLGSKHHIGNPIHVYPLYENAFRAHKGQSIEDNHAESAQLYADFAQVASKNAYSWSSGNAPDTAEAIGSVTKKNRMICFPYPMLMNAFNNVNLAAACILTSVDEARRLGISEEQWIYPLGGAGTRDSYDCNNYSMHAITEMMRHLRSGKARNGLVLANGGWVTYQHVVILSSNARKDGSPYPAQAPLPEIVTDVQVPTVDEVAEGVATVETYTVEFSRDGKPLRGHVVGRLGSNGHRFIANHADERTLDELSSWHVEPIGRKGNVKRGEDGRNLWTFGNADKQRL